MQNRNNTEMTVPISFCLILASPCNADTSEHQRVGVERKDPLIISPGVAISIHDSGEADAKHIRSGSGYQRLCLASSFIRFMDPVALVIGFEADTTLERKERFGTSREPFAVALPSAITWSANSRLALQARHVPGFSLPPELNGDSVSPVIGRSLYGSLSATLSGEKNSGGIQIGCNLMDARSTPSLTFYYSRTITLGDSK